MEKVVLTVGKKGSIFASRMNSKGAKYNLKLSGNDFLRVFEVKNASIARARFLDNMGRDRENKKTNNPSMSKCKDKNLAIATMEQIVKEINEDIEIEKLAKQNKLVKKEKKSLKRARAEYDNDDDDIDDDHDDYDDDDHDNSVDINYEEKFYEAGESEFPAQHAEVVDGPDMEPPQKKQKLDDIRDRVEIQARFCGFCGIEKRNELHSYCTICGQHY